MPYQIIEVDHRMVERFMGGVVEHPPGEPYVDTAFRTVLFADMEDSTGITQRLGDARAMVLLRTHDEVVREALAAHSSSAVKHAGDGMMAGFASVTARSAARCGSRIGSAMPTIGWSRRCGCGSGWRRANR